MANWSVPRRYLRLTLFKGDKLQNKDVEVLTWVNENARVSFNSSESVAGSMAEANINIVGLTKENMAYIATSFNVWRGSYIFNTLQIDAGYYDNHSVIFEGNITEATPNLNGAEYSIQIKAVQSFDLYDKTISISKEGTVPLRSVVQELADFAGWKLVYDVKEELFVENVSISNKTPMAIMTDIIQMGCVDEKGDFKKVNLWANSDTLYVALEQETLSSVKPIVVNKYNMVGVPQITQFGVNVDVRLNGSYRTGQQVILESDKFPIINSKDYKLLLISHTFDTKSADWKTHLVLQRKDIFTR